MRIIFFYILSLICLESFSQEKDLRFYMEKAQNNSPLLKDLSNQIQSNTIDSLLNRATYKAQITGNLNANYAPVINGVGYDAAITNGQSVSGLVGINQKIIDVLIFVNIKSNVFKTISNIQHQCYFLFLDPPFVFHLISKYLNFL